MPGLSWAGHLLMALTSSFLGKAPIMSEPSEDQRIAALKHELAGYIAAGQTDRAAQVRAQLAGDDGIETAAEVAPGETAETKPKRRK